MRLPLNDLDVCEHEGQHRRQKRFQLGRVHARVVPVLFLNRRFGNCNSRLHPARTFMKTHCGLVADKSAEQARHACKFSATMQMVAHAVAPDGTASGLALGHRTLLEDKGKHIRAPR
jgi:hypothetical protein